MLHFVVAGVAAGGVSYFVGLPLAYAAFLAIAIVAVAFGVTSALTVKVPQVEPKPRKIKADKSRQNHAGSSTSEDAGSDISEKTDKSEDNKTETKATSSKRDKERAKKAAKKEAEEKQKQADAERVAAEEKQKAVAAKAAAAAQKAAETAEKERLAALEAAEEEEDDEPAKKNKKKKKKKTDEKKGPDSTLAAKPSETKNVPAAVKKVETTAAKKSQDATKPEASFSTSTKQAEAPTSKKTEAPPKFVEPAVIEHKVEETPETKSIPEEVWNLKVAKKPKRGAESAVSTSAGPASSEQKVEITLDPKSFGLIIGKAGATLKLITDATQTTIDLSSKDEGRVTVSGPNRENIDKAIEAMTQLATKGYSVLTHGRRDEGSIVMPYNKRFNVIGPGGQTVKLIQEKFKVKVNLPDRSTTDTTVTVLGENADVQEAIKCIADLIDKGYSELTHPGCVRETIEVPSHQLGYIIGSQGVIVREIQESSGAKIIIEGTSVTMVGQQSQVTDAKNRIAQLLTPAEPLPADPEWSQEASSRYVDLW
jgi:rRNA processing protein Krr1/Pno1